MVNGAKNLVFMISWSYVEEVDKCVEYIRPVESLDDY
jgi:hypothetical protein